MKQKSPGEAVIVLSTLATLIVGLVLVYAAQKPTQSISITGKIKAELKIQLPDLQKLPTHSIGNVTITNHLGDAKGTARDMKGVLLREVLQQVQLDTDNPKLFSEYYFTCKASDGYKAVYSWNELFNTKTGDSAFIVLEKDNQNMSASGDNFLMISAQDTRTGRRYVKNLETIIVGRAD